MCVRGRTASMRDSVPALLVVGVFVDLAAVAVEANGAALGFHVDLKLAGGTAALPAVVAVAQAIPSLAEQERNPAPRRNADVKPSGQSTAELGKGIHALLTEEHGNGDERVDDDHVAGLDADGEEQQKLRVAIERANGSKQAKDATETAEERDQRQCIAERAAAGVDCRRGCGGSQHRSEEH